MTSRKWVGLFMRTLILGGLTCLIVSFFVKGHEYAINLSPFNIIELLGLIIFFIGFGFVVSVVSQAGFFSYLFIHQFGIGMFRTYWTPIQAGLIAFVVFDLIYFPYRETKGDVPIYLYILMALGLLLYGLIVAKIKADQTNKSAFIPAVFLMVVVTTIEWIPGLQTSGVDYALLMIFPLLVCNTYQLLVLHKLTKEDSKTSTKTKKPTTKQKAKA